MFTVRNNEEKEKRRRIGASIYLKYNQIIVKSFGNGSKSGKVGSISMYVTTVSDLCAPCTASNILVHCKINFN